MAQALDLAVLTAARPVLVSDDEIGAVTLYRILLERANLTVVAASHAAEVLAICRAYPISLVFSDVMKPDITGIEMTESLRADPVTRSIPILICSAGGTTERIERAYQAGADAYLTKPILHNDVAFEVCRLLETRWSTWSPTSLEDRFDVEKFRAEWTQKALSYDIKRDSGREYYHFYVGKSRHVIGPGLPLPV